RAADIVDRALAFRADQRPQTIAELRAGLGWADEAVTPAPVDRPSDPAQAAFEHATAMGTVQAFDGFLALFPDHALAERARAQRPPLAAALRSTRRWRMSPLRLVLLPWRPVETLPQARRLTIVGTVSAAIYGLLLMGLAVFWIGRDPATAATP